MPSQEDYLDGLLKELNENKDSEDEVVFNPVESPEMDDISGMGEDEIMQLLSSNDNILDRQEESAEKSAAIPEDVVDMFPDSEDDDLRQIQELLKKTDNNELIEDTLQTDRTENADEEAGSEQIAEPDRKQQHMERMEAAKAKRESAKAAREEKRAAKAAEKKKAREAKALKAAEAKAAKEARVKAAKKKQAAENANAAEMAGAVAEEEISDVISGMSEREPLAGQREIEPGAFQEPEDDLFDMSVLDSIVSEADISGTSGKYSKDVESAADSEDFMDDLLGQTMEEAFSEPFEESPETESVEENSVDVEEVEEVDLSSLFGAAADGLFSEQEDSAANAEPEPFEPDAIGMNGEEEPEQKNAKGFFARLFGFLTEEDDLEEAEGHGNENIPLSEENQGILNDLDKEKEAPGKKKGKKEKKEADNKKKEKPPKEKKPKKPKKQKEKPEGPKIPKIPEKKLSIKKMLPIILFAVSLGVLLLVFVNATADYTDKRTARTAFYEGDYQTCYQNFIGKDLNESELVMFAKSESILYIRLWIREYEMFVAEGDELRALESLIITVDRYPDLYQYAVQWNAGSEVAEGYAQVLSILSDKYGLTEEQAQQIADEPDDVEYTRMIWNQINGTGNKGQEAAQIPDEPLPDLLPEEGDMGNDRFFDNSNEG